MFNRREAVKSIAGLALGVPLVAINRRARRVMMPGSMSGKTVAPPEPMFKGVPLDDFPELMDKDGALYIGLQGKLWRLGATGDLRPLEIHFGPRAL